MSGIRILEYSNSQKMHEATHLIPNNAIVFSWGGEHPKKVVWRGSPMNNIFFAVFEASIFSRGFFFLVRKKGKMNKTVWFMNHDGTGEDVLKPH